MMNDRISDKLAYPSKYVEIYGSKMHYIEAGSGDPILFLHGVPTSSYLWRNIIPHLSPLGRCIAPDLIGFGRSDKPDIEYSVFDHIKYIEKFIEVLGLKRLVLVMHGWGSVIGFNYAMSHESNCRGLVFYESYLEYPGEDEVSLPLQEQLLSLRDQENLSDLVVNGATFVDKVLPQNAMRQLTEEQMTHYREPFLSNTTVKPITQYINELPRGDRTGKIDKLIADYTEKLSKSSLPKLLLYSVPGFITTIAAVIWAKDNLPNLEIIDIGEELHLAQESNPQLIGETISVWLQGIEQARK